ncbi:MAG: hypothetical protein K2I96_11605 [Lachnospiraceae bacterium]|nr:hypothetical protein [Lachnospiraceae bacterium]
MEKLFINIFQMSISASYLILAVLIVRFLLRKAPKSMRSFLWLLVGIRLLIPFSVESVFSLIPNTQTVDEYIYDIAQPGTNTVSNTANTNTAVSQPASGTFTPAAERHVNKTQTAVRVCTKIWLAGMALMLGYLLTSWLRLRNRVKMSVPMDISLEYGHTGRMQKIYQNSAVESPFLFGIIKPRIYIPNNIAEEELPYVVQHELTHLKRKDYLIKPAGFLLLSVYWFNPCVWTAYIMLCKDIELICDEKVIRQLGASYKKAYSQALLNCAADRRMIAACPVAFGEVSVKERVKNILNYKKPAFWVLAAAVLACIIVPVCFMTQKKTDAAESTDNPENTTDQSSSLSETIPSEDVNIDDLLSGSYEMLNPDQDAYTMVPSLTLKEDEQFSFTYDPLSSYFCAGEYYWTENILHLVSDDEKYHYQFTYADGGLLLFDAANSSDVPRTDEENSIIAPVENGSIFVRNSISAAIALAHRELAGGTERTDEERRAKQESMFEIQKQLTTGKMQLQWQLEKVKELQLTQEESAALETRLQQLIQQAEDLLQQLDHAQAVCQSEIEAEETNQTAYEAVEQWAQAFCNRDSSTIVKLADEKAEENMVNRELLQQGFDGGKDYVSFGWSSPWPWGVEDDGDTSADNYRIINVTDRYAEILYYAWVSDPHVTVWREQLTFEMRDGECVITSETLQHMDYICTVGEFQLAYPDGITGTMMDYSYNGAGEALNDHAKNNRDSQGYNQLFEPDSAAVYLLNILNNPNKVGTHVRESAADADARTVVFDFYEDGSSVSVQMVQPYGSDGIWVPWTDPFDVLKSADTASIAPYIVTTQNVDATIRNDAKQLEALFPDHHNFAFNVTVPQNVDLNGDGVEEKIEFTDLRYNGGDGGYALTVTDTRTGEKIPLPDGYTEESGFPIRTLYSMQQDKEQLSIQLGEEKKSQTVAAIMLDPLYTIYERKNLYAEFKRVIPDHSCKISSGDALSGCNIVTYRGEESPVIILKTYVSGFLGHVDTLGYVITELRLQKDHTWASRHYFLLDSCADVTLMRQNAANTEENGTSFLPFNDRTNADFIQLAPE